MNARSRGEADTQLRFFQSQADPAKTRLDATAVDADRTAGLHGLGVVCPLQKRRCVIVLSETGSPYMLPRMEAAK